MNPRPMVILGDDGVRAQVRAAPRAEPDVDRRGERSALQPRQIGDAMAMQPGSVVHAGLGLDWETVA
jgi:hypothetical protein